MVKNKKVIYTFIFGGYDDLKEPEIVSQGWDYICFTDDKNLISEVWEIKQFTRDEKSIGLNNKRLAMMHMILFHKVLPQYDVSISIGGQIKINCNLYLFLKNNWNERHEMISVLHPQRDFIYEEAIACLDQRKDENNVIEDHINRYKKDKYPAHNGLYATGVIVRKHSSLPLKTMCELWFDEYIRGSKRDQLSLNYAIWKSDLIAISEISWDTVFGGSNPCFIIDRHNRRYINNNKDAKITSFTSINNNLIKIHNSKIKNNSINTMAKTDYVDNTISTPHNTSTGIPYKLTFAQLLWLLPGYIHDLFRSHDKGNSKGSILAKYLAIHHSGLFDYNFYYLKNPDVAQTKMNGIIHYLKYGSTEGRDPSKQFKTKYYLNNNIDVKSANINPLYHYIKYGKKEGRRCLPRKVIKKTSSSEPTLPVGNIVEWEKLYGNFNYEKDYSKQTIHNLQKESGWIRGEIVKSVKEIAEPITSVLLPGEYNRNKNIYSDLLNIDSTDVITAGLDKDVDFIWNFENDPPDFGRFDLIISQAMLEHLIDPYKHVRDLYNSLNKNGHMILHTVIPGFPYHRYPIDCMRFFPDWFEEVAKRLKLEVKDRYIGELRILYRFKRVDD